MVYSMEYMYLKRGEGGASDVLKSAYLPSNKALVGLVARTIGRVKGLFLYFPLLPTLRCGLPPALGG